jgi:RNA ligase (TIGR02306 family)
MSTFEVAVVRLDDVQPHPNADKLDLAVIGGYRAVVQKDLHRPGDLVLYVPEDSIIPQDVVDAWGFTGKLSGSKKNRVKAIKLRGELSQGLVIPAAEAVATAWKRRQAPELYFSKQDGFRYALTMGEGDFVLPEQTLTDLEGANLADTLGITKYEEEIPVSMRGIQRKRPSWFPKYTDVQNIKKYNRTFVEGEEVIFTEKIHGTNFGAGMSREDLLAVLATDQPLENALRVSSRNFVLERDDSNVYWRAALEHDLAFILGDILTYTPERFSSPIESVVIFGEIFGPGVQDLGYGVPSGEISLRWFDLMLDGTFVNAYDAAFIIGLADPARNLRPVPALYRGPFSQAVLDEYTKGKDTLSGTHVREGVVVKPVIEREGGRTLGRVILKSVNEDYLLRKSGTERQ